MPVQRVAINDVIDGKKMVLGYQDILYDENGTEIEVVDEVRHAPEPVEDQPSVNIEDIPW